MNALHTILTIIQVILAVGLVVIVTIQSSLSVSLTVFSQSFLIQALDPVRQVRRSVRCHRRRQR